MTIESVDEALRALNRYLCQCGSGGGMACDEDCPGDTTPEQIKDILRFILGRLSEDQR